MYATGHQCILMHWVIKYEKWGSVCNSGRVSSAQTKFVILKRTALGESQSDC